jgi:Mn2+/Fe2+ NRAMP family transporter
MRLSVIFANVNSQPQHRQPCVPFPASLLSRNPLRWVAIFGPGAVIASLTIGVGELIFSTRAGSLFGYRLLWFFLLVLALKWVLVFASSRHIVLTGAHPFERWMELPGPRGWFPLVFLLLAVPCFPIWVCFHAGTLGTLLSSLAGTEQAWRGGAHYVWGAGVLAGVLALSAMGGYRALERIQLVIVLLMLGSVVLAVFFIRPDWFEFFKGLLVPQPLAYPLWVTPESHPDVAGRPVWLETTTYVGVIGGSSYDYLAYVSYLREKHWGRAGMSIATPEELTVMSNDPAHENRRWLRAPLVDCTLSFLAVLVFTAVFVVCGAVVLGPQHKVPGGSNLLSLQAEFVASVHPWLKHVYFAGAFLAVFGTLYGTIEVAPTILREWVTAFRPSAAEKFQPRLRFWSVAWVGVVGLLILVWSLWYHLRIGTDKPPGLIAILTPANLFTGVLGCGLICLLNAWMDCRFLPRGLRPSKTATVLSAAAGLIFLTLGLRGCWDHSGWLAFAILAGSLALGWLGGWIVERVMRPTSGRG